LPLVLAQGTVEVADLVRGLALDLEGRRRLGDRRRCDRERSHEPADPAHE
jgi:hypothetical protein